MVTGRESAVATLGRLLEVGRGAVVVGPAGLGKTALLRAAVHGQARAVRWGQGLPALQPVAYHPLRLAVGVEPSAADPAGVAAWVAREIGGAVVVLDDLHWADAGTLETIPYLAALVPLLTAVRTEHPDAAAALDVATATGLTVVEVEPLTDEDAATVVRQANPALVGPAARRVVAAARGNPFLLRTLAAGATEQLRLALEARLGAYGPGARRAVALLALLGRSAEPAMLGSAGADLVAAGLAVRREDGLSLDHALIGDSVVADLPDEERRRLHAWLACRVGTAGEAARHHLAAGAVEHAYRCAIDAARQATTPGERAEHLRVAVQAAPRVGEDRLRLQAAEALTDVGRGAEAESVLDTIRSSDSDVQIEADLWRAKAWLGSGRVRDAERLLEDAARRDHAAPDRVRVLVRVERARSLVWQWNQAAVPVAEEAWTIARSHGVEQAQARAVLGEAHIVACSRRAVGHLRGAMALARRQRMLALECTVGAGLMNALRAFGDPEASYRLSADLRARTGAAGLAGFDAWFSYWKAYGEICTGRLDVGIAEMSALLDTPLLLGPLTSAAEVAVALALADAGRPADAGARLVAIGLERPATPAEKIQVGFAAEAWLSVGDAERALWTCAQALAVPSAPWLDVLPLGTRAWAEHELGRPPARAPRVRSYPEDRGALLDVAALWALPRGRGVQGFTRAADQWRPFWLRHELRSALGAARALELSGQRSAARTLAGEVQARALRRGHTVAARRAQQLLRTLGSRPKRAGERGQGRPSLTPRQRHVLDLVAQGVATRGIAERLGISPATAESHVAAAKRRLGADTRRRAAAIVGQPRADPVPRPRTPIILLDDVADLEPTLADLRAHGFRTTDGFDLPPGAGDRLVAAGVVATRSAAHMAVRVAVEGHGVVAVAATSALAAELFENLSRIAPVELRTREPEGLERLHPDARRLLGRIARGESVAQAAAALSLSRRTAYRRLSHARAVLDAATDEVAAVRLEELSSRSHRL